MEACRPHHLLQHHKKGEGGDYGEDYIALKKLDWDRGTIQGKKIYTQKIKLWSGYDKYKIIGCAN